MNKKLINNVKGDLKTGVRAGIVVLSLGVLIDLVSLALDSLNSDKKQPSIYDESIKKMRESNEKLREEVENERSSNS